MIRLEAPDPAWPALAQELADGWRGRVAGLIAVHHIGSTAVPGLPAKPVIDLLPVFESDAARLAAEEAVRALGYDWRGANGVEGRSFAQMIDTETGDRRAHAHCFTAGHPEIARHLAFRDALRGNAALRAGYTSVKANCAARHAGDRAAYVACKAGWIERVTKRALAKG